MTERWLPIAGFEGYYEVSSMGRVRAMTRTTCAGQRRKERILRPFSSPDGYMLVKLCRDSTENTRKIHRLVCAAFNGPQPSARHEVAHNDGTRTNNVPSNLRWATRRENVMDRDIHGTMRRGSQARDAKLSAEQVIAMREERASKGTSYTKLGAAYGISGVNARKAVLGINWSHITAQQIELRRRAAAA